MRISEAAGQARSDCHIAAVAFADPEEDRTSAGALLRNVARTTPYGHNGSFRRLDEVIELHASARL